MKLILHRCWGFFSKVLAGGIICWQHASHNFYWGSGLRVSEKLSSLLHGKLSRAKVADCPGARSGPLVLTGRRHCDRCRARRDLPNQATEPPLDVAGSASEVVLQPDFGQTTVASPPQTMRTDQFALRPFDGVAMLHASFELVGLLRLSASWRCCTTGKRSSSSPRNLRWVNSSWAKKPATVRS